MWTGQTLARSRFLPRDINSRRKLSSVSRVFLLSVSSVAIRAERCASEDLPGNIDCQLVKPRSEPSDLAHRISTPSSPINCFALLSNRLSTPARSTSTSTLAPKAAIASNIFVCEWEMILSMIETFVFLLSCLTRADNRSIVAAYGEVKRNLGQRKVSEQSNVVPQLTKSSSSVSSITTG